MVPPKERQKSGVLMIDSRLGMTLCCGVLSQPAKIAKRQYQNLFRQGRKTRSKERQHWFSRTAPLSADWYLPIKLKKNWMMQCKKINDWRDKFAVKMQQKSQWFSRILLFQVNRSKHEKGLRRIIRPDRDLVAPLLALQGLLTVSTHIADGSQYFVELDTIIAHANFFGWWKGYRLTQT